MVETPESSDEIAVGDESSTTRSKKGEASFQSHKADSKSISSMYSERFSIVDDGEFDKIWGKSSDWIYSRHIREMAIAVHRAHGAAAIDAVGGLPKGPKLKLPSIWMMEEGGISAGSLAMSASSFKIPSTGYKQPPANICDFDPKKEILTEIRDEINEEEYFFKEIHPRFSGNYSVLIWTPFDSISPKTRLNSPFEIITLSFCPHDANYLVGGTSCGLLVLWDLTDKLDTKVNEDIHYTTDPSYIESQRVINSHLKWRRSKRSFNQIHPTAITMKKDSHLAKIIDIQWIHEDKEFDVKSGKLVPRTALKPTLQFITTSEDRVIKVWDMRSEPKPPTCLRYPDKGFSRSMTAKRPSRLQKSKSKFSELNRRWLPIYTAETKHDDTSFLFSTGDYSKQYYLGAPSSDGGKKDEEISNGAFYGTLSGEVGHFYWEGQPFESATSGAIDTLSTEGFKIYHDGPVNCVSRHPSLNHVCLTTGGHIFAIWNLHHPAEPIKWVRNREVLITFCGWSKLRHSLFRIARADGLVEFWDLLLYSHRPKIDPLSTGNGITMAVDLHIPPDKHFIAIADVKASLRLFYIAGSIQPLTDEEFERLKNMIDAEPERKKQIKEWCEKWLSEHVGRKEMGEKKEKEEVMAPVQSRSKEPEHHSPCNPFMAHLYRWYIRRRGDKSVWLDEADRKWYAQEMVHMRDQIFANKMWDQKKMDVVMRQLDVKEKRETTRQQRVQEILNQADEIFQAAVADIFVKKEIELKASKISVKLEEPKEFDIESAIKETQLLFGPNSKEFEEIKLADVAKFPVKERKMLDVLSKYRQVRMVFNDSRRFRDSKLKWLRNKLRKEVERYGCELIESETKTNTLMKWGKYERRIQDIDQLREIYGIKYNPLWDKGKRVSKFEKRMAIGNIPIRYTVKKKEIRKYGMDLESIIRDGDVTILKPQVRPGELKDEKEITKLEELIVEQETTVPLEIQMPGRPSRADVEFREKLPSDLPEIKKSVSFAEAPTEEKTSSGVLPLPDIIPRSDEPPTEVEREKRPFLETMLSRPTESTESSETEDFDPDIAVMEQHKDVDEIVDKLSSVYAMLKADVNIKPELHRFKWETTEEYLVSDDEDEKKSELSDGTAEEEEHIADGQHEKISLDPDIGSEELFESNYDFID